MNFIQHNTKRILQKIGLLEKQAYISAHERKINSLCDGYDFFHTLAQKDDVKSIRFDAGGAIIALSDGRMYHLDAHNKAARMYSVPFEGIFEPGETQFVRQTVRTGDACIDVGANFGWFTVLLSQLAGERGQVHAFEPIPGTIDILRKNVNLNSAHNVRVVPCALDEQQADRDIFVPDVGVSGSFTLHHYRDSFDQWTVKTITLDQYVADNNIKRLDFLKADIEGAEFAMLKGGAKAIEQFHPTLMLEVQQESTEKFGYQPEDLFNWLSERGYHAYYLDAQARLNPVDDARVHGDHYNFAFIHKLASKVKDAA